MTGTAQASTTRRRRGASGARQALLSCGTIALALALAAGPARAQAQSQGEAPAEAERRFQIPRTTLSEALRLYGQAAGRQIIFTEDIVRNKQSRGLSGTYTAREALARLLRGSGLRAEVTPAGAVMIMEAPGESLAAGGGGGDRGSSYGGDTVPEGQEGISEILVVGSRSQNVDIRRTEDDPQPYLVFKSEEIEASQALNLEEFFRKRLNMNTQVDTSAQNAGTLGSNTIGSVNLRGLGLRQTLILIDGRRQPRILGMTDTGLDFIQSDINGIPMSSVERIEVLHTTASGIYGGGAVGGVINIVRKRDSQGLQLSSAISGGTAGGGENIRLDAVASFAPLNGTQIFLNASMIKSRPLYVGDNNLWKRGRQLYGDNDPAHNLIASSGVNIRSSSGVPLVLDNGTPLNANHTHLPVGYAGVAMGGTVPLQTNAGSYDLSLSPDTRGEKATLLDNPDSYSLNASLRQEVVPSFSIFIDGFWSQSKGFARRSNDTSLVIAASAPNHPFQQTIRVTTPAINFSRSSESSSKSAGGTVGLIAKPFGNWRGTAEYSFGKASFVTRSESVDFTDAARNAIRLGTIDIFKDPSLVDFDVEELLAPRLESSTGPFRTSSQSFSLRASGPVFELLGGKLNATVLAEHREETAKESQVILRTPPSFAQTTTFPERSQKVSTLYGEVTWPIIRNRSAFLSRVELQVAARHDRYETEGTNPSSYTSAEPPEIERVIARTTSTDFTVAASADVFKGVTLRASYSTGFLPPSITQVFQLVSSQIISLPDPQRGGEIIGLVPEVAFGGNPDLSPESSRSISLGLILKPVFLNGLRVSVDYTHIRKKGEITSVAAQELLLLEDQLSDRIVRGPRSPDDDPTWLGPIEFMDLSLINAAKTSVKAYDFSLEYLLPAQQFGEIGLDATATYQPKRIRQRIALDEPFNDVGYNFGTLKWRAVAGIHWRWGKISANWSLRYLGKYRSRPAGVPEGVTLQEILQGEKWIGDQIYNDVGLSYRLSRRGGAFEIGAGITNLFNEKPPAVAAPLYGYSPYGDPRMRRFTVKLTGSF